MYIEKVYKKFLRLAHGKILKQVVISKKTRNRTDDDSENFNFLGSKKLF